VTYFTAVNTNTFKIPSYLSVFTA